MIIIRTDHDTLTHYLHEWSSSLIKLAKEKGFNVTDIKGKEIDNVNVKNRISKHNPSLVFFNGHGSKDSLFNNDEKVFIDIKDAAIFKNRVVYTRACDCLKELGKKSVEKGCDSFIGYKNKFILTWKNSMISRPLQDNVAKPILEASNLIIEKLLKGSTVKEAVDASHEYSAKKIIELIYSEDIYAHPSLPAIVHNDAVLDIEGNSEAKIIN